MGLSKSTGKYCKPIAMDQYARNGIPVNIGCPTRPILHSKVARRTRWNDWETVASDFSIVSRY